MSSDAVRPTIVSVQSQLVFGCAGNNAAVPVLTRLGATVHAVPTVLLSNTPHYPTIAGGPVGAELVGNLLNRLLDRVAATDIDAILTGYIGTAEIASVVAGWIDRVRAANPDVVVLCDPVMGDARPGLYVPEPVAAAITHELVPRADVLTPNLFEARRLAGTEHASEAELASALLKGRAAMVVVTGVEREDGSVATLLRDHDRLYETVTPLLPLRPTGTGDVFSAALLYGVLGGRRPGDALSRAVEVVVMLLEECRDRAGAELDPNSMRVRTSVDRPSVMLRSTYA